ncbi:hypothetical protein ONS95_010743 [Cadophora gregata]|uniref:uncharacterized protein n=1 Tax=Cadophora gregata TaxID=51156 RepID=UPI0026DB59E6|nr:uncharacterized protein ONS95_010743 [Cadophora gregata]KAK0122515.1 hypothetical protein ONS95_010743 [Cadophora gregata]KAK0127995.1 hypothetical protein ONS96_007488 [Cadophora gregata f. sp. sojae]
MSSNFQFAFLGCQNNYLASVTEITASERPVGPSITETYGLPDGFAAEYKKYARKKYFFNIRGHDSLSHIGRWHTLTSEGNVKACSNSYAEIPQLASLALQNAGRAKRNCTPSMNVTFGPQPGSFFADLCEVKEYRWSHLPPSLESKLQSLMTANATFLRRGIYGKIFDVAINASEGWVLLMKKGEKYERGGELPPELIRALELGVERKAAISRIFLNHQNPFEYVLLFSDGIAHISLHEDFHEPLRRLLKLWATNRHLSDKFRFHPRSTCAYPKPYQRSLNACYYNARGLFHLARGNNLLALSYFNEAHEQNRSSEEIHLNLGMALVAVRKSRQDEELEIYLATEKDLRPNPIVLKEGELGNFRMSYVGMDSRGWDMVMLERGLDGFMERVRSTTCESWTCSMVGEMMEVWVEKGPIEMPGNPLDGRVYSHELSGGHEHG